MTFTGINKEICQTAWDLALPSVRRAAQAGVVNKLAGTIVVLHPKTGELYFVSLINLGHPDAAKFTGIAEAKAKVSWETGLPSRVVQQSAPHLYQPGWTKWGGSAVENGLVVAFSGVQAVFDEAISWQVLKWIVALCQHEMTKEQGVMASGSSYIDG